MHYLLRWLKVAWRDHLGKLSWPGLLGLLISHIVLVALLLQLSQEVELVSDPLRFLYFYVVTISTVGYGDFSPSTGLGQFFTLSVLIIPGLGLFGAFLGKFISTLTDLSRRKMQGKNDFSHWQDHILLFGWNPQRTRRIVELILGDKNRLDRKIILCMTEDMDHPLAEFAEVSYLHLSSYTEHEQLYKTGLKNAAKVIIDSTSDEQTLTIALAVGSLLGDNSPVHISAYFEDETKANLLSGHMPNIECSTNRAAELLTRSMQDPGSSHLIQQLLSTLEGCTQFSMDIPDGVADIPFHKLFMEFKLEHQATAIGVAPNRRCNTLDLNPDLQYLLNTGDVIYYISQQRVHASDVNWLSLIKGE